MRINLNKMQKFWHTKYFKTGNNSLKNKGLENNKILDRSVFVNELQLFVINGCVIEAFVEVISWFYLNLSSNLSINLYF